MAPELFTGEFILKILLLVMKSNLTKIVCVQENQKKYCFFQESSCVYDKEKSNMLNFLLHRSQVLQNFKKGINFKNDKIS